MKKLILRMCLACIPAVLLAGLIVFIDPYLHYHEPVDGIYYHPGDSRWINDGIVKRLKFDTLYSGTSLDENVDFNLVKKLFSENSVKTTYPGAKIPELAFGIRSALESNNVSTVIMSLNFGNNINCEYDDWTHEGIDFPYFLYDDKIWNDWQYLFNFRSLEMVLRDLLLSRDNEGGISFYEYGKWPEDEEYGKKVVLNGIVRSEQQPNQVVASSDIQRIRKNVYENLVKLANDYPDTCFYYYIPPKSVVWWDQKNIGGSVELIYTELEIICEELLSCNNVKVFYFLNEFDIACDLDNYQDTIHYGEWINNKMIEWMAKDERLVTKNNYQSILLQSRDFYSTYNYDSIYE